MRLQPERNNIQPAAVKRSAKSVARSDVNEPPEKRQKGPGPVQEPVSQTLFNPEVDCQMLRTKQIATQKPKMTDPVPTKLITKKTVAKKLSMAAPTPEGSVTMESSTKKLVVADATHGKLGTKKITIRNSTAKKTAMADRDRPDWDTYQ